MSIISVLSLLGLLVSLSDAVHTSATTFMNQKHLGRLDSRILQQKDKAKCGDILATYTSATFADIVDESIDDGSWMKAFFMPLIHHGVQIRKICAVCTDFEAVMGGTCGYGGDVAHSGLIIIPLKDDNSTRIAEGTHKAIIYNHGTQAVTQPSTGFDGINSTSDIILNAVIASFTRAVCIMPDYMAQGESFGKVFPGYLIRNSYVTSVVPLYLQATKLLEDETECSAVADAVFIAGFSEGGYASIAVADKMSSMGIDIIRVDAGGAPFWISSAVLVDILDVVNKGLFPSRARFYFPYLGFGFSSTRSDMPNFEAGQDMLTSEARQNMLDFLASDIPEDEWEGQQAANALVPEDDMLSIFNPDFLDFLQTALAENERDPCKNRPIVGTNDLLCQALQEQDLHMVVQNATYPVVLCFSPDDEIVPFRNLPANWASNPNLVVHQKTGSHGQAGGACITDSAFYLIGEFLDYPVIEKRFCQDDPTAVGLQGVLDSASAANGLSMNCISGSLLSVLTTYSVFSWLLFQ